MDRTNLRRRTIIAAGILLGCFSCAFAVDPTLDVSQYAHKGWRVNEGFSKGAIFSIAQTSDGYLWLGTDFGLVRFDGVRTVPWRPPAGERLPSSYVTSLRAARDGRLWIGTSTGLASLKDGRLTHYPELDGQVVEALFEDHEGTIWVAGWSPSLGRLCEIQSGKTHCNGEDGRFGAGVTALYEDSGGNLWAGGMTGLWRWNPGPPKLYPVPDPAHRINALIESDDGGLLIAKNSGITKLRSGKLYAYPLPAGLEFQANSFLRDRNGGLWIGAAVDRGLFHIHEGRTDLFTRSDGLSGNSVSSILEDREGNIWVATLDGLDSFRDFAVPTISVQQGLSSHGVPAVLAAKDGSVWLGTDEGLNRWRNGQVTIYRKRGSQTVRGGFSVNALTGARGVREITDSELPDDSVDSLFQDDRGQIWVTTHNGVAILKSDRFFPVSSIPYGIVFSVTGDSAGNVWMSHQEKLFHLREERVVEAIPWAKLGRREPATALIHDPVQGGLWLGFRDGGVAYLEHGLLRASYTANEGLGQGKVGGFHIDANGTLWAATEGGLGRIKDGRALTLTTQNGLPCNMVHWMMEDDAHSVWLYLACGLVRIPRSELEAWASDPRLTIHATLFDSLDGVRSQGFRYGYSAIVAKSADGKLWFLPFGGVSVIDPHHLAFNKLLPPVHIEQISADDKTYDARNGIRLPPRTHYLTIDYTALSLTVPEKVHFRYKLEGADPDWREVVNDREVQYTNLAPKHYRFLVKACNNSGVWNEEGATLEFVIPPAWYQTNWFRASWVAAFLVLLWALYQMRVRQMARQFNMRLEERVGERTRIARDLHDTLLQSFHGILLFLQSGIHLMPEHPSEGMKTLQTAVEQAERAILEGREAVQGLRASTVERNDLASAIKTLGGELAATDGNAQRPEFSVQVEGIPRNLHPILRDEVYRIAGEGMRNAFRHADAKQIEVEIHYDERRVRVRVRDDGKGIDPNLLSDHGREGHFGLRGMRERAKLIGGKLTVWSELDSGTEVELSIPASRAYTVADGQRSWLAEKFAKLSGKDTELKS